MTPTKFCNTNIYVILHYVSIYSSSDENTQKNVLEPKVINEFYKKLDTAKRTIEEIKKLDSPLLSILHFQEKSPFRT